MSSAGLDCLFTMIKVVSLDNKDIASNQFHLDNVCALEFLKNKLWMQLWNFLHEIAYVDVQTNILSFHFCQNLSILYTQCELNEFRYSENTRILLGIIVGLSRSHIQRDSDLIMNRVDDVQLIRAIVELINNIRLHDFNGLFSFVSALSNICFGRQILAITDKQSETKLLLEPISQKLSVEIGIILNSLTLHGSRIYSDIRFIFKNNNIMLEIVLKSFVENLYQKDISTRLNLIPSNFQNINEFRKNRLLNDLKDQLPTGFELQIIDDEKNSVDENSNEIYFTWKIYCHTFEADTLFKFIRAILNDKNNNEHLSLKTWEMLTSSVSCLIGPWKCVISDHESSIINVHELKVFVHYIFNYMKTNK